MKLLINALLAAFLSLVPLAATATSDELDEARVRELVYEAIRDRPEIIVEALELLQQRDQAQQAAAAQSLLSDQRFLLERDPNAPVLGNPDGDVTVVEFFDYNCPFCKRAMPEVQGLLADDGNVRLVYREWPILGEGSDFAARAALASRNQGQYEEFHTALMGLKGRVEEASVLRMAKKIGLDVDQLRTDMGSPEVEAHIATSMQLAQTLGFSGTPSFVIGDARVPGFVEQARLQSFVDESREAQ
ncbi:DsbA family protein [Candidatus Halocynthiibacter alkanivorans]|uniref:DsbA family protein n=1 Tax=Candidatus Halocynthiibacter alkanivorans TaxID=2267619 RepID=UPI000DF4126D|nr:DsbA family protein [Candidatus Halocynthiibacter alkanivorans]